MKNKRIAITLNEASLRILDEIKKTIVYKENWLSEFVNGELSNHFEKNMVKKDNIDIELENIRLEVSSLNKNDSKIKDRIKYLADKAKELREKRK